MKVVSRQTASLLLRVLQTQRAVRQKKNIDYIDAISLNVIFQKITYFMQYMRHHQLDHILIDRIWHSRIIDVRSFKGADFDTDHYLMLPKLGKDWQ